MPRRRRQPQPLTAPAGKEITTFLAQAALTAACAELDKLGMSKRAGVIVMVGIPDQPDDRHDSYRVVCHGPCLTVLGLLKQGGDSLTKAIDQTWT